MAILTLVFILSGAAGLIYESIWSRYLGLFVGHSAYAQIIVLVIFLGGMSVGAWIAGERSHRVARPLRAYALVELAAGAIGLLFHPLYNAATGASYDSLFPALAHAGGLPAVIVAKWMVAALLILPQSILLGATFPLMSAGAIRLVPENPGRTLSLLYFANSLGAAAGVLIAGFLLLPWGGLPGTLWTAAILNVLVAAVVIVGEQELTETERAKRAVAPVEPQAARERPSAPAPELRLLLWVAFGTAVASFVYEIAWIRMLSLVLGSATHSFELMLSAFILGLALGAWWVRTRADRFADPVRTLGIVQWVMGALAIITLPVYVASFHWVSAISQAFAPTLEGYRGFLVVRYVVCLVVMLPATICAGMTLPLITRTLFTSGVGERAIGRVYAVNTLGSILGVILAGLLLMPVLGLEWLLVCGALVDIAFGGLLLWRVSQRGAIPGQLLLGLTLGTLAFVALVTSFTSFDRELLTSGVFRYTEIAPMGTVAVRFYRDGRTATVSVRQTGSEGVISLATNGKPDASVIPDWLKPPAAGVANLPLDRDLSTQVLLPLVTLAHRPGARSAAVIGQGSGLTSHFLLGSPNLANVATVEIEPEMVAGSRAFYPFNKRVFDDRRSHFVIDDAKSYFAAAQKKFDIIISEPSNPWVSGVSGLFTREFYHRVQHHLAPNGVFGQWLHLYEIDDRLVTSVLAALDDSFADYTVYLTSNVDLLVIASNSKLAPAEWQVAAFPAIASDLARARPLAPAELSRLWLADRSVLHPMLIAHDDEANSDFTPVLDLGTEKARYTHSRASGWVSLSERRFDLAGALDGRRSGFGTVTQPLVPGIPYIRGLAQGAKLRAHRAGAPDSTLGQVGYDDDAFRRLLAANVAPSDWHTWLAEALDLETALHKGTAGVADEGFYTSVMTYAAAQHAPEPARAALSFVRGVAEWNWPAVLQAAPVLAARARDGDPWINPELLRDASVVAALKTGDTKLARQLYTQLTGLGPRDDAAYAFRSELLGAQIIAADRASGRSRRADGAPAPRAGQAGSEND